MKSKFKQVDVFSCKPFKGNPVAVVLDAEDLTSEQMQGIASWTNVSETTFVTAAQNPLADYSVRIFTPTSELPFAGHPTIGTAYALIEAGLVTPKNGMLTQQCEVGLVPIRVENKNDGAATIFFELPKASFKELTSDEVRRIQSILGITTIASFHPMFVNVGPLHTVVQLQSAQDVLSLKPNLQELSLFSAEFSSVGVIVFGAHEDHHRAAIESRAFFPILGITEDPVCGSGNGAIAAYISETNQTSIFGNSFVSSQGEVIGREGEITLRISPDSTIEVGGACITTVDGAILLKNIHS